MSTKPQEAREQQWLVGMKTKTSSDKSVQVQQLQIQQNRVQLTAASGGPNKLTWLEYLSLSLHLSIWIPMIKEKSIPQIFVYLETRDGVTVREDFIE